MYCLSEGEVVQIRPCIVYTEVLINKLVWPASEVVLIHSSTLAYCSDTKKNKKKKTNRRTPLQDVPFLNYCLCYY